jgi:biopolymer transport protein ExbD
MNASQVRAKARMAMKRRSEEIEADELESGEINLIPYLDIVTNLMLFLLATISAGFVLGQINTTLPDHVEAESVSQTKPEKPPNEKPLQLVVSATKRQLLVWSVSGLEGTLKEPKAALPRTSAAGEPPAYDYHRLNDVLYEIAKRRWGGKARKRDTYEVILQADGDIPYESIIHIMDNMRRRLPESGMPGGGFKPAPLKVPAEGAPYNPDRHPLFPDILFSMGFE